MVTLFFLFPTRPIFMGESYELSSQILSVSAPLINKILSFFLLFVIYACIVSTSVPKDSYV